MKLYDICVPKNNEEELIEVAKELNYEGIIFLYDPKKVKQIKSKDFETYTGILIKGKKLANFKRKNFSKADFVVAEGDGTEDINKLILSNKYVDFAINISSTKGGEHTHYRKSTLNQVLAKLASKNNINYVINFSRILNEKKRIKLMGRIIQNIKIFQKFKVPILIASFATNKTELRNNSDLTSFAKTLGSKKIKLISETIHKKLKSGLISKGVKIVD